MRELKFRAWDKATKRYWDVAGQIGIFVDRYDMNEFGDQERRVYRIQKDEE